MKKFIFLYYGFVTPTEEIMDSWNSWFASLGDSVIDPGNPFASGVEITRDGTKDLPLGLDSVTGYSIINAAKLSVTFDIRVSSIASITLKVVDSFTP